MVHDGKHDPNFDKFLDDNTQPYQPPQHYGPPQHYQRMPNNHLVGAILATLFCCLPFGVVAIVMAAQVNTAYNAGNYVEAERLSRAASNWTLASFLSGLLVGVIYFMAVAAIGM